MNILINRNEKTEITKKPRGRIASTGPKRWKDGLRENGLDDIKLKAYYKKVKSTLNKYSLQFHKSSEDRSDVAH